VLLPAAWLSRRADAVSVIGAALLAKATGAGHRVIAVGLGRPPCTVRGWSAGSPPARKGSGVHRPAARTGSLRRAVVGVRSVFADAVEALGRAATAAALRLGPCDAWEFAGPALAVVGSSDQGERTHSDVIEREHDDGAGGQGVPDVFQVC
jgi:hypothetical protein